MLAVRCHREKEEKKGHRGWRRCVRCAENAPHWTMQSGAEMISARGTASPSAASGSPLCFVCCMSPFDIDWAVNELNLLAMLVDEQRSAVLLSPSAAALMTLFCQQ
jgi:hypothetical protein